MKNKDYIFNISGGVGKNIMATAAVRCLRQANPDSKIYVSSPHTAVWKNNPDVTEIINPLEVKDFYPNHVQGKDIELLAHDPYMSEDFIYKRKHLIEVWCDIFNIPYKKDVSSVLEFSKEEKEKVKSKLPKGKLFFIQTSGGAVNQDYPISWMRDMPLHIGQRVVDEMTKKGYTAVHIRRENQYALENATWIPMTLREMLCSIQFSDKRLFIDSVAQHAAAAFKKESVVTWIGNKPEIFGYEMHKNILPNVPEEFRHFTDSYLEKYNITGVLHECPYNTNDIFDVEDILSKLD